MIRSIILALAESPYNASAKNYAFWLAKKEGSHVHALAVVDITAFEIPVLNSMDGMMPAMATPSFVEGRALTNELIASAQERLDIFAGQCAEKGISYSSDIKTGIPEDVISTMATAHDIVVISRSGYRHIQSPNDVDAAVAPIIRNSVRPVLVAGSEFKEEGDIHKILVAFDGSMHAARALTVAADLAARPGVQCDLVTVASSEEQGQEVLSPAEDFLYHHGIVAHKEILLSARPSEEICRLAASGGADLLVIGAYGHNQIREAIFGSTTARILANCGINVVLQS
jgi:nucleotide-binding universal stress UspA family protein